MTVACIGTSGYYYREWIGTVYPEKTKDMYNAYIDRGFNTVELNFSYYRMPDNRLIEKFSQRAPDGFNYIIKAFRGITHEYEGQKTAMKFAENFKRGNVRGNYAGILFQFPESFHYSEENLDEIFRRTACFNGIHCYIEFRGSDWNRENVYESLKGSPLHYVITDLPPKENLHVRDINGADEHAYYRLHGRNQDWYNYDERYHYDYNEDELSVFAGEIRKLEKCSKSVFVFFNNCHGGFALKNAMTLKSIMLSAGQ